MFEMAGTFFWDWQHSLEGRKVGGNKTIIS